MILFTELVCSVIDGGDDGMAMMLFLFMAVMMMGWR